MYVQSDDNIRHLALQCYPNMISRLIFVTVIFDRQSLCSLQNRASKFKNGRRKTMQVFRYCTRTLEWTRALRIRTYIKTRELNAWMVDRSRVCLSTGQSNSCLELVQSQNRYRAYLTRRDISYLKFETYPSSHIGY